MGIVRPLNYKFILNEYSIITAIRNLIPIIDFDLFSNS